MGMARLRQSKTGQLRSTKHSGLDLPSSLASIIVLRFHHRCFIYEQKSQLSSSTNHGKKLTKLIHNYNLLDNNSHANYESWQCKPDPGYHSDPPCPCLPGQVRAHTHSYE